MRFQSFVAAIVATSLPLSAVAAQTAPAPTDDSAEDIAKDAARDLKDSRFYNKPGATRAQYDADWQECRLIARGSQTPTGTVPYYYNPAVISPLAAGIGAGIGGLIAGAIAEGQQRRANRRTCLMIKGWRLVEPSAATSAKVAAMDDAQRDAYFNAVVGAENVQGEITERTTFALQPDPALNLDGTAGPGSVFLGKKIDPAASFALAPGEGAVVLAFRRPDEGSAGRSASLSLARYDVEGRDLVYQPRDWKKKGDKTTYSTFVASSDRKAPLEVHVIRLTAGDYVVTGTSVGKGVIVTSNCFGAPTFQVRAGEVVYLGDFIPFMDVKLSTGSKFFGLAHAEHFDDARKVLAEKQPELAASLQPAVIRNRATYGCSAITMDRWDLPGKEELAPPAPKGETVALSNR
ncbi:hypothetical protein [Sphingosinicella sp. BN140058]|uniref:hypothetical protein n=1 Tax=Sphingosinicella sp. BN140058 TaxID=1892855 RepID=UPI0010112AF7|nr:hypothetical protein [Sphingosinicella sp. BN140058]QAY76968.1 hypothetical protein ETR14_11020 [Sphingosinicella sp. BN140058]